MAREIKVEVFKREIVKPWSPTPENCQRYELSFLDQILPTDSLPLLLFYLGAPHLQNVSEASQLLMKSLSETLTRFYHFAGRLRDNIAIECNDAGAEFAVARVNCPLSAILANPEFGTMAEFLPSPTEEQFSGPLLVLQASFFDCGGLAIGVRLSHKVADASTLSTFFNCWAATASKPGHGQPLVPQFISPVSIFPPLDSSAASAALYKVPEVTDKVQHKRLVFHGPRIEALRSKSAGNTTVQSPTRVEAVSALLWKCAIEAYSVSNGSKSHEWHSYFSQAVNIRKRMNPSLPENSIGNFVWSFQAKILIRNEADNTELKDLALLLRAGIDEFKEIWKERTPSQALSGSVQDLSMKKDEDGFHQFLVTSWCRFSLYDTDFGWGKPIWIAIPNTVGAKNACGMLDSRDGEGIEVTVCLGEEEMKHFQTNPELLAFASLDPVVIM